ncbi:MAG: T9SS type A sorting domain-containing protein [Flavobacteriales bacterium]|nr:T9SS type A sorting domain-containing protein [Flavobacteriales bacterium]
MKGFLLLLAFVPASLLGQVIFSENFDSLQAGDRIAASDPVHWRTVSGVAGTNEDASVTDTLSNSPNNSLEFVQMIQDIDGGPVDEVLLLGYHVWGSYVLSWRMFVPTQRGAILMLVHGEDVASDAPAAVITFTPSTMNTVTCDANGATYTGNYPHNTWFTVTLGFDLDDRTASFLVNNSLVCSWNFDTMPSGLPAPNVLGSLRFKAASGWLFTLGQYYIDDILFQEGTVGIHELEAARPLAIVPNPSAGATVFSANEQLTQAELYIHDASGRVVWQGAWPAGAERYSLPAGMLAPGAYVVRVASRASATAGVAATAAGKPMYTGRLVVMP